MLRSYFIIALRNIKRNKIYSFINICGLAIGIACTLAIGLFIVDEYSFDRFHANFSDIYRITERQKQADGMYSVAVTPGPLAAGLTRDFPEVKSATRYGSINGLFQIGTRSMEVEQVLSVDSAFFDIFSFPFIIGSPSHIFKSPDEVVLNEVMAAYFFGSDWASKDIIGRRIEFNGKYPLKIVGIVKNAPQSSSLGFDALLPFSFEERRNDNTAAWDVNSYFTYIQLNPDVNPTSFENKISNYLQRYDPEVEQLKVQALGDIYLKSSFDFQTDQGRRGNLVYVRVFLIVGLIVLAIALINFINLTTARATDRAGEVGVRKAIGAKRTTLITQFLVESYTMISLAVAIGCLLLQMILPTLNKLSGKSIEIPIDQPFFWVTLVAFSMLTGLIAGLYPALYLSSYRPARILKGLLKTPSGKTVRQSLVIGQFTLSIVLAIGTMVIYCQLSFIKNKQLGFDQSGLLYVQLRGDAAHKVATFKNELKGLPGVGAVTATSATLVNVMTSTTDIEWKGKAPNNHLLVYQMYVDENFIPTTGISMLSGDNFLNGATGDTISGRSYIINETAARKMGYTVNSAVGKQIRLSGIKGEIKGVVSDFHYHSLREGIDPFAFSFGPEKKFSKLLIKTIPGTTNRTLPLISKLYKQIEPNYPINYGFVDQDLQRQYNTEQQTGDILFAFTLLAMLVSCLGLFGLATFMTLQRIKEIGIRKVLGASMWGIILLFLKDFLRWILIAFVIATPIAWLTSNRWLQGFSYKIGVEWWMFASVGAVMVTIALLTVAAQSARAALSNPVEALRS